jgi:hypothetical protein
LNPIKILRLYPLNYFILGADLIYFDVLISDPASINIDCLASNKGSIITC